MNTIAEFIQQKRKETELAQEEFAIRSGLGVHFVLELEQEKETVRMDKVDQARSMSGIKAVPGRVASGSGEPQLENRRGKICKESYLPDSMKTEMEKWIHERIHTLR